MICNLFIDKGKLVERQGRKATGPKAKAMAAWPPKERFTLKKVIALILMSVLFAVSSLHANATAEFLDASLASKGVIGIEYLNNEGSRFKVVVSKESKKYYYDYSGLGKEHFPLQSGNGKYEISILENLYGTTYKLVRTKSIEVNLSTENIVYLQSVQNVSWKSDMSAIYKAAELTEGLKLTSEKVEAVYNYIVTKIDYDYEKINQLDNLYVPDIETVFKAGKGICYDYASLFASMLRSQGIPAKLIKGCSANVNGYHAWNEVFLDGKWMIIDTTYDAIMIKLKKSPVIEKNVHDYETAKTY